MAAASHCAVEALSARHDMFGAELLSVYRDGPKGEGGVRVDGVTRSCKVTIAAFGTLRDGSQVAALSMCQPRVWTVLSCKAWSGLWQHCTVSSAN
jgi:hypothetical protein